MDYKYFSDRISVLKSAAYNYLCASKTITMSLQQLLTPQIKKAISELFDVAIDRIEFQATRREFEGDLTMVLFPFLKLIKGNPVDIGNKIGNYLVGNVS